MERSFQAGDVVEYTGPETGPYDARPGERGRLFTPGAVGDPPPEWVVLFDRVTGVYPVEHLRLIGQDDGAVPHAEPTNEGAPPGLGYIEERPWMDAWTKDARSSIEPRGTSMSS